MIYIYLPISSSLIIACYFFWLTGKVNFCKYTVNLEFTSVEPLTPDLFSPKEVHFETEITKKKKKS